MSKGPSEAGRDTSNDGVEGRQADWEIHDRDGRRIDHLNGQKR